MIAPETYREFDAQWSPYFRRPRFFLHSLGWLASCGRTDAYWEFGAGVGSLRDFYHAMHTPVPVVLFDTFTGLPATDHPADQHPDWAPGKLATSVDECAEVAHHYGAAPPKFVIGEYATSLEPDLAARLPCPMLVSIDTDYYTSTRDVLAFLDPILVPGTLLYFDDIWAFHGHPEKGQVRAIHEYNRGRNRLIPHWLGVGSNQVYVVAW